MAIEQEKTAQEAKAIAVDSAMKQQAMQQKQQFLEQMAQAYSEKQPITPQQQTDVDRSSADLADKAFLSSQEQELERMQKAYVIAAKNGMTSEANTWRDNITATQKAMFDYSANIEKEKAGKITKAANTLLGVTDQATYQTALEQIRDNVDVALAQKMFKQLGPVYNKKVAQQIQAMAMSGVGADKQIDDKRADQQLKVSQDTQKETVRNNMFNNKIANSKLQLSREGLAIRKESGKTKDTLVAKQKENLVKGLDGINQRFSIEERSINKELSDARTVLEASKGSIKEKVMGTVGMVPSAISDINAKLDSIQKRLDAARALKEQQKQSLLSNYAAIGIELGDKTSDDFEVIE